LRLKEEEKEEEEEEEEEEKGSFDCSSRRERILFSIDRVDYPG